MRQSDVQALFLRRFDKLYPQLKFRAIRHLMAPAQKATRFGLRVAVGRGAIEVDLLCSLLGEGDADTVRSWLTQQGFLSAEGARLAAIPAQEASGNHIEKVQVLVAPSFSSEACALLQAYGVGYLDLEGNAFLDTASVYLQIGGRASRPASSRSFRSPFKGKGERVVRRLLLQPRKRWTMRQLARTAHVSLGLASMTTSALAQMGLISKDRSGAELFDPSGLLDAWVESYRVGNSPFVVWRSDLSPGDLRRILVAERGRLRGRYALTLWSGAKLRLPETEDTSRLALYWLDDPQELVDILKLKKEGRRAHVFVFQPYDEALLWGMEAIVGLYVVHPLQLYLDLVGGDKQEKALAQRLRKALLGW
ncbi:MAG: hypothetical protein H5T69_09655 [Chloroflexi bacterium]|nr:hypothetical protein [Chloroflexota bacterium]